MGNRPLSDLEGNTNATDILTKGYADALYVGTGRAASDLQTNSISLTKLAQLAGASVLGASGAGNVSALTLPQLQALFSAFNSTTAGLVPASGGGTTNFLRADGTWYNLTTDINNLSARLSVLESRSSAPSNTVLPVVSGTTNQGQTLTSSTGTWSYSPTSYTYQWNSGGSAVSGATSSTYALTNADVGSMISCTVTAINANGAVSITSVAVGPVTVVIPTAAFNQASNSQLIPLLFG